MKNLNVSNLFMACVVLLAAPYGVYASTIIEGTDFPGVSSFDTSAASVGVLDLGPNTISGSLSGTCTNESGGCNSLPGDTQDSFLVEIGQGFQLGGIFVTTSNVTGPTGFSASFAGSNPSSNLIFEPFLALGSTTSNLAVSALDPGVYSLSVFGQSASEPGAFSLDYSIGLNVSPVPIPAAVLLYGSGLAGLLAFKRYIGERS